MLRLFFTFVLVLLNLGWLSCFIYIKTHTVDTPERIEMRIQSDFLNIHSIQLKFHADNSHFNFEKEEGQWYVKEPIAWEANPLAISHLLQQLILTQPQFSFKVDETVDLNNYGLATPFCVIKCTTPEHTHILHVGNATQDNHKLYLLESETNEIFVLDAELLKALSLPLEQWCNTTLFHFSNLKSVTFESEKQKIFLKNIQDVWHMKSPLNEVLDQQHAKVVCQQLIHLEFARFLTPDETQKHIESFVTDNQIYHLTLMDENNAATLKILPFDVPEHLYVAQRNDVGPLFFIHSTVLERLMFAQETLRERTLFHLDFNTLDKITYQKEDTQIVLQAVNAQHWEVVTYQNDRFIQAAKARSKNIRQFITHLNELYIEQFLEEVPDVDKAECIYLKIDGNEIHHKVRFYFLDEECFVQMDGHPHFFQLTDGHPPLYHVSAENFQDKLVWQWAPNERPVQILLFTDDKSEGTPISLSPEDQKRLAFLKAKQWLTHDIRYPLVQPKVYTLKITTQTPEGVQRTYTLQFDERLYGALQSGQYLSQKFTFTQRWIDLLFKITHQNDWNFWSNYIGIR